MMKIDELPAGRELDRLIAEKVMGWCADNELWYYAGRAVGYQVNRKLGSRFPAFLPSTSMGAAWQVVHTLLYTAKTFTLAYMNSSWQAQIRMGTRDYIVYGDSASLVICRVALKAMGISKAREG